MPDYLAEVPLDPTSGQPFRYKTSESGYVIYSPTQRFALSTNEHPDARNRGESDAALPLAAFAGEAG